MDDEACLTGREDADGTTAGLMDHSPFACLGQLRGSMLGPGDATAAEFN
jgi:hypothetical protein